MGIAVDSFDAAESLCSTEGGHLAYVKTQAEDTEIVDYFFGTTSKSSISIVYTVLVIAIFLKSFI